MSPGKLPVPVPTSPDGFLPAAEPQAPGADPLQVTQAECTRPRHPDSSPPETFVFVFCCWDG